MSRIVFIDRDGVINVDPLGDYVKTWQDFRFEEGALEALREISDSGFEIIIISNQAGVGDGVYTEIALWDIHLRMMQVLEGKGIRVRGAYYCLHGKEAGCKCRKPETGLFEKATEGISFEPSKTFLVGDKASDVEAGKRFGLRTIFVRTGHGKAEEPKLKGALKPDHVVSDLRQAARLLAR